jgi:simple sugar transport system permease protein
VAGIVAGSTSKTGKLGFVAAKPIPQVLRNINAFTGDSRDAALALGFHVNRVRALCTMIGGFLAGVGGSFLSLYYPGSCNEGLSSGQGLMAVALVVFARWEPLRCLYAALLFGAAGALGPALQSVGITSGYYLFNVAPYVLTLLLMLATCSPARALAGMPQELGAGK